MAFVFVHIDRHGKRVLTKHLIQSKEIQQPAENPRGGRPAEHITITKQGKRRAPGTGAGGRRAKRDGRGTVWDIRRRTGWTQKTDLRSQSHATEQANATMMPNNIDLQARVEALHAKQVAAHALVVADQARNHVAAKGAALESSLKESGDKMVAVVHTFANQCKNSVHDQLGSIKREIEDKLKQLEREKHVDQTRFFTPKEELGNCVYRFIPGHPKRLQRHLDKRAWEEDGSDDKPPKLTHASWAHIGAHMKRTDLPVFAKKIKYNTCVSTFKNILACDVCVPTDSPEGTNLRKECCILCMVSGQAKNMGGLCGTCVKLWNTFYINDDTGPGKRLLLDAAMNPAIREFPELNLKAHAEVQVRTLGTRDTSSLSFDLAVSADLGDAALWFLIELERTSVWETANDDKLRKIVSKLSAIVPVDGDNTLRVLCFMQVERRAAGIDLQVVSRWALCAAKRLREILKGQPAVSILFMGYDETPAWVDGIRERYNDLFRKFRVYKFPADKVYYPSDPGNKSAHLDFMMLPTELNVINSTLMHHSTRAFEGDAHDRRSYREVFGLQGARETLHEAIAADTGVAANKSRKRPLEAPQASASATADSEDSEDADDAEDNSEGAEDCLANVQVGTRLRYVWGGIRNKDGGVDGKCAFSGTVTELGVNVKDDKGDAGIAVTIRYDAHAKWPESTNNNVLWKSLHKNETAECGWWVVT